MRFRDLNRVVAAVLVAGSLGAVYAHAEGLHAAGNVQGHGDCLNAAGIKPLRDESPPLGYVDDPRVNLQTSHIGDGTHPLNLDSEPLHWLHSFEFHDAWENYHLPPLDDRPQIEQYRFGIHIGF